MEYTHLGRSGLNVSLALPRHHELRIAGIAGKSQGRIAEWLNSNGYLRVIGRRWRTDTVRRVLRAPNTAELLGETKAAQLRAALRAREQTRGERTNGHMLLRVAFCQQCECRFTVKLSATGLRADITDA